MLLVIVNSFSCQLYSSLLEGSLKGIIFLCPSVYLYMHLPVMFLQYV